MNCHLRRFVFALVTATSATVPCAAASLDSLPTDAVFAPDSFWYKPIPTVTPLHPNSAGFVADFLRQKQAYYGTVSINLESFASPVYVVDGSTPTVSVVRRCPPGTPADPSLDEQWSAVPIPAYALPAKGSDSEMTIFQPSMDRIWEFWVMHKIDGKWGACWGGRMQDASKSIGNWPGGYGTTATSLPFLGGQITAEELRRGEIRHAIGIMLVEVEDAKVFSWPATRSDGINPTKAPNRIPEGLRFRLDPTIDVDALQMHPIGKVIAKAAQKYGFIVWDKAGAITLRSQNPLSYTRTGKPDPYPALFAGTPSYAILYGFPWERLQFLPMDYGRP